MTEPDKPLNFGESTVELRLNPQRPDARTMEAVRLPVEIDGESFQFTITLGSITEAPTDAILCPSNRWFELAGGEVENVIHRDAGDEPFIAADELMAQTEINMPGFTREQGVPYSTAKAFPSGKLKERGINYIIFSNVLPHHQRLTEEMVSYCVAAALLEADNIGVKSLAVPAIGTGFIGAMQGFSMEESLAGIIKGLGLYKKLKEERGGNGSVEKLSLVIYTRPSEENAVAICDFLRDVLETLARRQLEDQEQTS